MTKLTVEGKIIVAVLCQPALIAVLMFAPIIIIIMTSSKNHDDQNY